MQYEDPVGQEAARKTVPICELEEKALVSLAKVSLYFTTSVIFFSHSGLFLVLFQCKMYFMILLLLSLL
jgi:peptide-N4-(N-acetyl-beta-glucosaminyl)asparagine amidase